MIVLILATCLQMAAAQLPTTCSILTKISPYILAYTMVDYQGAQSVCAEFSATLAFYTPTMNTEFGLWTEICNFYYNSVGQTVTTAAYTPPFWVDGTSADGTTSTLCAVLPYGVGQATSSGATASFANCNLQFYPLCQQAISTSTVIVATAVVDIASTVDTVTVDTTVTDVVNVNIVTVQVVSVSTTVTARSVQTETTLSATTSFVTDLQTLTGSTTTTRTRTVSSIQTNSLIASTTTTTTTTSTTATSTQSTTTTTTLRTLLTCIGD